jgi:hypothetical protein
MKHIVGLSLIAALTLIMIVAIAAYANHLF